MERFSTTSLACWAAQQLSNSRITSARMEQLFRSVLPIWIDLKVMPISR